MKRPFVLGVLAAIAACGGGQKPANPPAPTAEAAADKAPPPAPSPAPKAAAPKAIEQPALLATPLPSDTTKTTIHRLSNGMTVYLAPDHREPTIVAHIAVRAGGRNDPENSTGLAHYLEHMLFKGTPQLGTLDYAKEKPHLDRIAALYADLRKPGSDRDKILKEIDSETQKSAEFAVPNEFDQVYAQIGITGLNAFTNSDATVYIASVPKNRIAQWAKVEGQRFSGAVFRLFWPELEAVYEEKNRSLDAPPRRVRDTFLKTMFPRHGYGWSSVLGEVEHLKSPAYADMVAFFERYYTPQNMAILLAGDVDESVLPLLESEFAAFKRPAGDAPEPGAMPALHGRAQVDVTVPSNEGILLGWPLVSATHRDKPALQVMDAILDDGVSGMLRRDLVLTQKVARAGSSPTFLREAGYFEMTADSLDGQSSAELEQMLLALVGKLQRGEFTDTDLATAILTADIQQQQQLESNFGRIGLMERSFIDGVAWKDAIAAVDAMRAVKKADIVRVANQYLTKDFLVVRKVKGTDSPPKITKPGITAVKVDPTRRGAFAKSILDMPVTPIEPAALRDGKDYERSMLATGPLITVKNDRNGLFTASHDYEYGRIDDKYVCLALEVMQKSGAGKRSAEQVARELHELGVRINATCTKDEVAITVSGVDRNLDAGMKLLREWLAEPALEDGILKARVATALTERTNAIKNPQVIASASQQYARYGTDTEFLVVASNKELQSVTTAQLRKSLAIFLHAKHRTSYFGPRPGTEAGPAIVLGDGKQTTRSRKPVRFRKPNTVIATDQGTAQTHVWFIWPRAPINDAERATGTLFSRYAAPLLFQEVREARGLAYTTTGGFSPGRVKADDASLFAYAGTQGDKANDALDALLSTLNQPIDEHRFERAKATLAEEHRVQRIQPRAIADVVYAWEDEGEHTDPREARVSRALKLDRAALEKWMKQALARPAIISIVGDRKKLDEAKLKKLAPITFVPINKLFGY